MQTSPASATFCYPLAENAALYDPAQAEAYFQTLFRNVDWEDGQLISLLGIGEKGTPKEEEHFRERKIVPPAFIGSAHDHLKRWAGYHVAGFIVPAVLHPGVGETGDVKLDKVAALTAIILDLDSGDTDAKARYVNDALGPPTMVIASGGVTDAGKPKLHLYWLFNEVCEDVERVAAVRKLLAAKVGGDQSFGRATQVVRVAGSVHAKNGKASVCRILSRSAHEYSFDDLADTIETLPPMSGAQAPKGGPGWRPVVLPGGIMDFTPRQNSAFDALHRDIHEGGEDRTRFSEFSRVAGFQISEARAGRITLAEAYQNTQGWMLTHMIPPWPEKRLNDEFQAVARLDAQRYGPQPIVPANADQPRKLPIERFADIEASLTNNWLVWNILPGCGIGVIYGYPGSGKSFLAIDIAIKIAAGWDVNGAKVKQGYVLYVAAEGASGVRNRIAAFKKHHGVPPELPFSLLPVAVDLLDARNLQMLFEAIDEEIAHFCCQPVAIFIDTLAATFGRGDENGSDMSAYLTNLAQIRDRYLTCVIAVHHRPKDQTNDTPRGHGSLLAGLDASILVDRQQEFRVARFKKIKDAPDNGLPISFELLQIELGSDEEGRSVTSAVVQYRETKPPEKLSKDARLLLEALRTAIERGTGTSADERGWRIVWEEVTPDRQDEARRKALIRGRKQLVAMDRIQNRAGRWSIVSGGSEEAPSDCGPQ
ncbi:MAG TPA: AAA family ATPase [Sphingomicrobium sp.]|nr:AAA family ATPase [Sphingomicrobium sp.]